MIEVEHLSKFYGPNPAIQDVFFSVEKGEILGFLGPNGAGKTTTMRILAGYLPATKGTARIDGYDVHENSMAVRKRIGYLPETPPLYPEMTVEEFLAFVARIKGIPAGDRSSQINLALQRCNLEEKRKVLIRKLSKGFRQRVGIAQAIVHNPPVIILDEPTVGLDPRQIIEVRHLIKNLAGEHTIILSTHILPEVSMMCDRVTIINRGKVVATDTPDNLLAQRVGESGYLLEVEGNSQEGASALRPLPGVVRVDILNHPEGKSDRRLLRVTMIRSETEQGHQLAEVLVHRGLKLYEMRRTRPSLEDVFLNFTTEEKTPTNDEPGEVGSRMVVSSAPAIVLPTSEGKATPQTQEIPTEEDSTPVPEAETPPETNSGETQREESPLENHPPTPEAQAETPPETSTGDTQGEELPPEVNPPTPEAQVETPPETNSGETQGEELPPEVNPPTPEAQVETPPETNSEETQKEESPSEVNPPTPEAESPPVVLETEVTNSDTVIGEQEKN